MKFYELQNYWYLGIVLIILLYFSVLWYKEKTKEQEKGFFINNYNYKKIYNILKLKLFLISAGLFLLLMAVWRPQWGQDLETTKSKGIDIVFTVDVSKSMKALDFSQNNNLISRLDATKYLINNFVQKRESDRFSLVEFAGESFVASPLTLDHSVFINFLKDISSSDIGKQGTNLSEALSISIARLQVQNDIERTKAIILFSDGDETIDSDIENIAKIAKDKNISIYTIGVGSEKGMPIPESQDYRGGIIYKKWKGETVLTKLNPEPLKKIAEITGGEYFHIDNLENLEELQSDLNNLPVKILETKNLSPNSERYWYFAFLGLIFFVVGFVIPSKIANNKNNKIYEKK